MAALQGDSRFPRERVIRNEEPGSGASVGNRE